MKILYLSRWFPFPADNGSRIRVFNTLKHLAEQHEVHLVTFADRKVTPAAQRALEEYCQRVVVHAWRDFDSTSAGTLSAYLSPTPRSILETYSPELMHSVRTIASDVQPHVILASQNGMGPYLTEVEGAVRILEELELGLAYSPVVNASHHLKRLRAGLTWRKFSAYIGRLLNSIDGYTVVSDVERRLVQQFAPNSTPMAVIPNAVELPASDFIYPDPEPDSLIYCGSPTFSANLDAVGYFVDEVLPLIIARRPAVRLRVTGELPSDHASLPQLGDRVLYTGNLPDVRPLLAGSWVSVVPLRLGGGTRLKVLESMAVGTPVVATSKAVEGIAVQDGVHCLIGDDPHALANAVINLLEQPRLRTQIGLSGKALVEQQYQWSGSIRRLEDFICERLAAREN